MNDPSTHSQWIEAARQRALDAETLLSGDGYSVGPVYMAGYALECSFKGLLRLRGENIPKGKEGHNLMNLRSLCNLPWSGIRPGFRPCSKNYARICIEDSWLGGHPKTACYYGSWSRFFISKTCLGIDIFKLDRIS